MRLVSPAAAEDLEIAAERKALSALRPGVFALYLAGDWALVAVGLALFYRFPNPLSFLLGSVLVGFGQHGLSVLGHEAVHYRVCENKRLNDFIGNLFCFMPNGITVSSYRTFHLAHHRDPFAKGDPELALRRALGGGFRPPYTVARGLKLWALSFLGGSVRELLTFAATLPRSQRGEQLGIAAYTLASVALALVFAPSLLGLWFYALATTFISKVRVQGWYEHGLEEGEGNRYALPSPFFRAFVPHNIWVHYEHHRYPSVPFYNLEKLRALESKKLFTINEMAEAFGARPSGETAAPAKKAA